MALGTPYRGMPHLDLPGDEAAALAALLAPHRGQDRRPLSPRIRTRDNVTSDLELLGCSYSVDAGAFRSSDQDFIGR